MRLLSVMFTLALAAPASAQMVDPASYDRIIAACKSSVGDVATSVPSHEQAIGRLICRAYRDGVNDTEAEQLDAAAAALDRAADIAAGRPVKPQEDMLSASPQ